MRNANLAMAVLALVTVGCAVVGMLASGVVGTLVARLAEIH